MAKSKRAEADADDEDPVVLETPAVAPAKKMTPTEMMRDREEKGSEVASALIVNGIIAYLSVLNKGVNLVAANRANTAFIPVKIVSRDAATELDLKKDEVDGLTGCGAVIAFLVGEDDDRTRWYLPVAEFLSKAGDKKRGESDLSIDIEKHWDWLERFEGHDGIRQAFSKLLK